MASERYRNCLTLNNTSSTAYEADGETNLITYANGTGTSFLYDPERRWVELIKTQTTDGTLRQHLLYAHDNFGRITSVASSTDWGSWSYTGARPRA